MDSLEAGLIDVLKTFTESQKERFNQIFASVKSRVLRNGGDEDEANGIAVGIALSAARNFTPAPLNAALETESHVFAIMAPEQLGRNAEGAIAGNEYSFDFLKANVDIAKEIAIGNTFNLDHEHDSPVGVITDVLLASEVEGIEVDADIPLVYVASYFTGTSDEIKAIDSVSAEWAHFNLDGKEEALPNTFAITNTPLNGKVQGVKRLANLQVVEGKAYKERKAVPPTEDTMSDNTDSANAALDPVELKASLDAETTRADAASEELATLKAGLANALGKEADDVTAPEVASEIASLRKEIEASNSKVAEIVAAALDKEAEEFAASLVKDGKVASDATEKFAGLYKTLGKEAAVDLAASLNASHIGTSEGTAHASLPEEEGNDVVKAALDAQRSKLMPKEGN